MPQKLFNFRDLGGLKTNCDRQVKSQLLFRTGNISHIPKETAAYVSKKLKIETYIDFRTPDEIKQFGRPDELLKNNLNWVQVHIDTDDPVFNKVARPEVADWVALYGRLFEKNIHEWVRFVRVISETEHPVMFGCLFGKDRTGIGASYLLSQLNVRQDQILADYAKTTEGMHPHYGLLRAIWAESPISEEEVIQYFLNAPPQIMENFLKLIKSAMDEVSDSLRTTLQTKLLAP